MSAAGGERRSLLNNPIFAGFLMVVAIFMIVYQWRNITGGVPRVGKRAETTKATGPTSPPPAAQIPEVPQSPPPEPSKPASESSTADAGAINGETEVFLQELTPPLRDPFAESVVMIEPLMGKPFEEREVLPPPQIPVPPPAPPQAGSEAAVSPARATLPELQVVLIITIGKEVGAVIKSSDQKELLVFPGDTLGEETVSEVSENGVILVGDYGSRALRLSGFQFGASRDGAGTRSPTASQKTTQAKSGG